MNYSKWDHIEVSDDEDDTHPNIDTPSLFRWRHQARLERDAAWKQENEEFTKDFQKHLLELKKSEDAYKTAITSNDPNIKDLEDNLNNLKAEDAKWKERQKEIDKKQKLRPLNIDTICKEGKSKTIINAAALKSEDDSKKQEDDAADKLKAFGDKYKKEIRKFGMFQKPIDSQQYLADNPNIVCEETANQLVLWCLELAMEEKYNLMNHVSHQCIVMQFMLQLAQSLKCDPRSCIRPFFSKFVNPDPEYQKAFDEELSAFRQRIRARAKVKVQEAVEKFEDEERKTRLGPGGLDPIEVFESLPPDLQECFSKTDVEMLKTTLAKMDPQEASSILKRCIDSGLWVENAGADTAETGDASEPEVLEDNQSQE